MLDTFESFAHIQRNRNSHQNIEKIEQELEKG